MVSRSHRTLRAAALSLVGGGVVAVAISWLAMFLPRGNHWYGPPTTQTLGVVSSPAGAGSWRVVTGQNAWHRVDSYWLMQVSGMMLSIPKAELDAQRFDLDSLPSHRRPRSVDDLTIQAWFHETGWPLPALSCSVRWKQQVRNSDIIYTVTGGVQLPRDAAFHPRALPLTPVWPGAALNTLLYAAAWFMVLHVAGVVRRGLRRRRGVCPACAYSRAGLPRHTPCPECGEASSGGIRRP